MAVVLDRHAPRFGRDVVMTGFAEARGSAEPTRSDGYPWMAAVLAGSAVVAIYLVLPLFAPPVLAGYVDVPLLGICLGLAVGLAVRVPRSVVPVVCIVAVIASSWQLMGHGLPAWPAIVVAAIVGAQIAALAYLVRHWGIGRWARPLDVVLLVGIAIVVAVAAAALEALVLASAGLLSQSGLVDAARSWALDSVFGLVCVAPAVITATRPSRWAWSRAPEFVTAAAVTLALTVYLFFVVTSASPGLLGWPYLALLGPLWIAARMGVAAVAPVVAVAFWLAVIATINGAGMFAAGAASAHDLLATVQIFAIVMTSTVLLLGVLRDERLRSLQRITDSSRLVREVVDGMPAQVIAKSYADAGPEGRYVLANRKWRDAHGVSAAGVEGARTGDLFTPQEARTLQGRDRLVMASNASIEEEVPGIGPMRGRTNLISKFPLRGADGRPWGVGTIVIDVTERVADQRALAEREELLRVVLDNSGEATMRVGRDLRVEYVNRRIVEISGIAFEDWIGKTFAEAGYPSELAEFWEAGYTRVFDTGAPVAFEFEIDNVEGHRWYESVVAPEFAPDGSVAHTISSSRDVTQRKAADEELRRLATHDQLTGLANRAGLLDEITRALGAGRRSGRGTAVLMIDLDNFKNVNDSLGHASGDELLRAAAARVGGSARGGDLVARLGGDEFVVVMRDLDDPGEAVQAAWLLVQAFRDPFTTGAVELYATASIGVSVGSDASDAGDLVREADTAMYVAKAEGRDRVSVFNEDVRAAVTSRLGLEVELRHALERDQLAVWYQPEVDLTSGEVIAVEALLRWHHPSGELYSADRFIAIAEETGLILDIGSWVLHQACSQAAAWAAERPDRPLTVRVNLSTLQLAEHGLLNAIDESLALTGLDPARLCMEITETTLLRQTATARDNLQGIRDRGITIAIDDFGTGYAALTYLRQYPIDVLKIDRSFITDITTDDHDHRLVAGIIAFARHLGVSVTAEGVEDEDQAAVLRSMGCPSAQGWLYSPAIPPEQVDALLDHTYAHP
ncbi:MAG: EAL domain-containing protein [Actinomycetota bacterium]|nr:EAL domain-containing protein [Actinomycetota bacterium]